MIFLNVKNINKTDIKKFLTMIFSNKRKYSYTKKNSCEIRTILLFIKEMITFQLNEIKKKKH